jgi:hypothetical protein
VGEEKGVRGRERDSGGRGVLIPSGGTTAAAAISSLGSTASAVPGSCLPLEEDGGKKRWAGPLVGFSRERRGGGLGWNRPKARKVLF